MVRHVRAVSHYCYLFIVSFKGQHNINSVEAGLWRWEWVEEGFDHEIHNILTPELIFLERLITLANFKACLYCMNLLKRNQRRFLGLYRLPTFPLQKPGPNQIKAGGNQPLKNSPTREVRVSGPTPN
ncbi:hypothetical protein AMECASPLE_034627 [Ameca splendens]|uniref:Uncharacterized protein n=1 Tax=Ameca splendens TaxID=208324 RepID=A0ABV0YIJ3_9TELE